ncbi:hypothetical protein KP509_07G028900 [Ceratopteris richardii]|uniref:Pentatricopeptide repeat-containing protein n=1 Tax=Ceratopteris richardii TaxID=49495 RepID=A0A8T2UDI2_CERRI|nr:hypothetical protein KP509_07G028900 [Ceratopteris richardii]
MYAKCGELSKAYEVLQEASSSDVVSWSALISGCAQQGKGEEALKCFEQMQNKGFSPNSVTYSCVLKACGCIGALEKGEQIHQEIAQQGLLEKRMPIGNTAVDMYAKCGELSKAYEVLQEASSSDVVSWSALISGCAQQGKGEEALKCFEQMQNKGLSPNSVTYSCVLKACGCIGALEKGEQIHQEIAQQGLLEKNDLLFVAAVDMYAKCGELSKAYEVLQEASSSDVVSWSALISGCAQQGKGEEALKCFEQMQNKGLSPNSVTYSCVLKACGCIGALEKGEQIHQEIAQQGLLEKRYHPWQCTCEYVWKMWEYYDGREGVCRFATT